MNGRIINYDPIEKTYELPPEHAALLTRSDKLPHDDMNYYYIARKPA